MGPYQRVRDPSPSHEHESSKDIELEDNRQDHRQDHRQDQEKSETTAEEESARLLPGHGHAHVRELEDKVQPEDFSTPIRPRTRWFRWGLYGLVGIVVFSIIAHLLARGSAAEDARKTARTFRRPSSDYIIPSKWDFSAPATARYQRWTITDITANPDGVFRPMTVINGKFPGPMIVANEGDTIVIDVFNHAKNATSIHWHGLFQNGTNHMDGTVGVTQCPIAPGEMFRYEFTVQGQAGTCKSTDECCVALSRGAWC